MKIGCFLYNCRKQWNRLESWSRTYRTAKSPWRMEAKYDCRVFQFDKVDQETIN